MSRAHVTEAADPSIGTLSLNGSPAGVPMPVPGAMGPAVHMQQAAPSAGYASESLEAPTDLEGVDLRTSDNKMQAFIQCEWRGTAEEFANASSINQRTCAIGTFPGAWSAVDADDRTVDLSRAVILGVTARSMHNSFPMPVAIKFGGSGKALNQLSTRLGKVAAVMAHKESSRGTHELYVPSDAVSTRHFRKYAHHTTESLRSDIIRFPGFDYVPAGSPIVQIMAANKDILCVDLNVEDIRESNYFRVDHQVVDRVLAELDRKILQKLPFVDLQRMSLEVDRTDGQPWNSPSGTPFQGAMPETVNQQMRVRHTISLELCVDYGFPTARK